MIFPPFNQEETDILISIPFDDIRDLQEAAINKKEAIESRSYEKAARCRDTEVYFLEKYPFLKLYGTYSALDLIERIRAFKIDLINDSRI